MSESKSGKENDNKWTAERILKALASLKFAVVIIIALGILSAWGTITEATFQSSEIATKVVYHSKWMIITTILLIINLVAVIIDRYPWKLHHSGFICAHVGIIVTIFGSVLTKKYGIDGSLALPASKEPARMVSVAEKDLTVWASFDASSWTKVFEEKDVDFYLDRPSEKNPKEIPLPDASLEIVDYIPFAIEDRKLGETDVKSYGPALRFQLQNDNVNVTQWLNMPQAFGTPAVLNLGPAKIVLNRGNYKPSGDNEIVLSANHDEGGLNYSIHTKREGVKEKKGIIKAGEAIQTGWMGLNFRVLKYIPYAKEQVKYFPIGQQTDVTSEALKIKFNGKEHWFSGQSTLKLFTDKSVYVIGYGKRRIDIGFDLKLEQFIMTKYQGTNRAATYASDVIVPDLGEINISMNEPLKHKGFTFYQASYQLDPETQKPLVSILSVNKDPGRWTKYFGSFLMVLGTILMFYFKRPLMNIQKLKFADKSDNEKADKNVQKKVVTS